MEIGNVVQVNSRIHSNSPEECVILKLPENQELAPCKCGKLDCRVFQVLGFVGKPGILRHVSECSMSPIKL